MEEKNGENKEKKDIKKKKMTKEIKMIEKEIEKLVKKGESRNLEFKESLSVKEEIGESVSAFSNTCKGIILIGVSNLGKIKGVQVGKRTIEELANYIKQNTDNSIFPDIKVEKVGNKSIIVIEVNEADEKPVFFKGKAYARIGNSNHKLSASKIRKLAKESAKSYWDEQICGEASLEDIDEETVNRFRERYEEESVASIKGTDRDLLKALNCIKEENGKIKITNAAILLFGKKPKKFFPMSYVTVARYPGTEKGSKYLDIKDFNGSLFNIVDEVNEYVKEHIQEISEVVEGQIARKSISQYPYFTIRELITNAVVHRDYANRGSRIIIRMFKDRIEFSSPGSLPANITPKNIIYEQYSRNPVIADVLHRIKYIEKLGEGWDKIIDSIKKHPLKPRVPKIIDTRNTVIVTLYSPKEMLEKSEEISKSAVDEWLTQVDAKLTQELSDKEKQIVSFILKKNRINSSECQELLSISREMAHRYFNRLIKKSLIEKKGAGKYVYYVLRVMQGNAKVMQEEKEEK